MSYSLQQGKANQVRPLRQPLIVMKKISKTSRKKTKRQRYKKEDEHNQNEKKKKLDPLTRKRRIDWFSQHIQFELERLLLFKMPAKRGGVGRPPPSLSTQMKEKKNKKPRYKNQN